MKVAESASKKRIVKKSETVRQKATKTKTNSSKRRVIKSTAGRLGTPLKALSPLLAPFRTKPMRKVGKILGVIFWPRFLRDAWRELRQVTWPTRKETWKLTTAVFVFAIIFGSLIAITDYGLDKLFKKIILK